MSDQNINIALYPSAQGWQFQTDPANSQYWPSEAIYPTPEAALEAGREELKEAEIQCDFDELLSKPNRREKAAQWAMQFLCRWCNLSEIAELLRLEAERKGHTEAARILEMAGSALAQEED